MSGCMVCPRKCRTYGDFCGAEINVRVAAYGLHNWEEPCISGENGSGAIFFSGCNLRCTFCQNIDISRNPKQCREMSIFDIRNTMRELADKGAHNINLVTPTHYTPVLSTVLEDKPDIPIVWNSGGYELSTTLESLRGKVDVFLPDMKYSDSGLGQKYSGIPDYFPVAQTAIRAMYAITGDYVIENGLLKRGVLIRHLMLPNELENTLGVIKWVSKFKRGQVLFSLMSQYTPNGANGIPMGQITQAEYDTAIEYMHKCGITNGYAQELSSARQGYVPNWFLKGQL